MVEPITPTPPLRLDLTGEPLGSYRVLEPLGSGGMSTVYRAVHAQTGHEVALKVLLGSIAQHSNLLQRFLREARSAESLEHPNIVAIYDRGVDQGRHYLVLEYVAGGDFHDYIQRRGPLDCAEAIAVVRGVASGLRYAATRGVIHRDVKPSNILRAPTGDPKIIDLGLALQAQFEDERVTREGTTVGTVDYMAPEQARDSRATSIQSDMYSLGCTFYYLLTGIPPYPGGDITEKLTRHARAPAPDIRDLRSEIPDSVALIILRLMAKEPEDRYKDYDELIAALDAATRREPVDALEIPLLPLNDEPAAATRPARAEARRARPGGAELATPDRSDDVGFALEPLAGLELADERPSAEAWDERPGAAPHLPRLGRAAAMESEEPAADETAGAMPVARPDRSLIPWFLATSAVAALAIGLVIGLHLTLGGPRAAVVAPENIPDPDRDFHPPSVARPPATAPAIDTDRPTRQGGASTAKTTRSGPPSARPEDDRREPADNDPVPGDLAAGSVLPESLRARLPEWARSPAPPPESAVVVVRRVPDPTDGPNTAMTLLQALDNRNFSTVEVADQGPLLADDLRTSGKNKVVRARYGYRPIVRITRSRNRASREQEAFLSLESETLVLQGLDLIVDVRELAGLQHSLFGCRGADLTLRDCTITVINPARSRFTLIRQEPVARPEAARRPSRIRLERTLVRGDAFALAELGGGPADLVLDGSAVVAGGNGPPLVTVSHPDAKADQRVFIVGTLIACAGPAVRREPAVAGIAAGRLTFRVYGSAIGRFQGPGVASVVAATVEDAVAEREIDWDGADNVFAGWKGFFARGAAATITVDSLPRVHSTWNTAENGSQEVPLGWVDGGLSARIDPGRETRSVRAAGPGPGLFRKTIDSYPGPAVPEPSAWAMTWHGVAITPVGGPAKLRLFSPQQAGRAGTGAPGANPSASVPPDLVMETANPSWNGDLGAFLRSRVSRSSPHVRVLVRGTGAHRFTPVSLPDGLTVEIQAVPDPANAEPPSWTTEPQAEGRALIELRRGALVLSQVNLRHDPTSRLESLIAVEDSHLVLDRCQLTAPPDTAAAMGDLVQFRAPTTRPMADRPGTEVFGAPVNRPVCRLIDTVLIAGGTAMRARVGRGLVALTNCAVAGGEAAVALEPSDVARSRFDADLWLERCTLVSGRSVIRLGPWPGSRPGGPDRPWLIRSRQCAFFARTEARSPEGMLLRVDPDAYARGSVFWQADGDAFDLDEVIAAGDGPAATANTRDVSQRWERFWSAHHPGPALTGPRSPAARLLERIAPQGPRAQPEVGADLAGLGIAPRSLRLSPRRN